VVLFPRQGAGTRHRPGWGVRRWLERACQAPVSDRGAVHCPMSDRPALRQHERKACSRLRGLGGHVVPATCSAAAVTAPTPCSSTISAPEGSALEPSTTSTPHCSPSSCALSDTSSRSAPCATDSSLRHRPSLAAACSALQRPATHDVPPAATRSGRQAASGSAVTTCCAAWCNGRRTGAADLRCALAPVRKAFCPPAACLLPASWTQTRRCVRASCTSPATRVGLHHPPPAPAGASPNNEATRQPALPQPTPKAPAHRPAGASARAARGS
jgi:hypothetical protein